MSIETKNARIKSTHLGNEDHGIMTCVLRLEYAGSGQCFGNYSLDKFNGERGEHGEREGTAYGMEFIRRIIETVGVDSWEKLPGQYIRVKADHMKVHAIGHIIEENWFTPETDLKEFITP